jgi:hypothetical protein
VTLVKFLQVLAAVSLILGTVRINYMFRARAMRALATRWGFQYIGPPAPKWWNRSQPKISPPLPVRFTLICRPSGRQITQIWNLIEGQQNGVSVVVFDSVLGEGRGSAPCTLIACQTEENPFGMVSSPDRVIQSHGWTILHGVWFLWFSWTMGTKRLDNYLNKLGLDHELAHSERQRRSSPS